MASFTIRVELHNADSDDYEELHKEMSGKGFRRTIISGDGVKYQLPDAEYNYSGETTRDDVLDKAYTTANSIKANPRVLVTESLGRRWKGLRKLD